MAIKLTVIYRILNKSMRYCTRTFRLTSGVLYLLVLIFLSYSKQLHAAAPDIGDNGSGICTAGSDILFIIDDSGSVDEFEYAQMQSSIVDVGNQLLSANTNHHIATMHFGGPTTDYTTGGQHVFFERDFSTAAVIPPVRQFGWGGAFNPTWLQDYMAGAVLHAGWGLDRSISTTDPYIVSPLKELARRNNIPLHILLFTDMDRNLELDPGHPTPNFCCSALIDRSDSGYQPDDGSEFTIYNIYKNQGVTFSVVGFNLTDITKSAAATLSSFGGGYNGFIDGNPSDPETGSGGKRLIIADPASFSLTPAQVALVTTNANCGIPGSDFGDAPISYGNVSHTVADSPTLYLGTMPPDKDAKDLSSINADGDNNNGTDDEDGITPPALAWVSGSTEKVSVDIHGKGFLNAWIDWNLDGDFDDSGEQISNEMVVSTGTTNLSIAIPVSALSGNLPARFRLCSISGNCNTPTGQAIDGEVEDYLISITSCTALTGDVSEIAAAIPFQVATGDKVFVASSSPVPSSEGHLKAYAIEANGSIGTSVAWDAATLMNTEKREDNLYSTDASGSEEKFDDLDDAAFGAGANPTVSKIKQFTIDPSVDSGAYLAGRANGSWLGPISRGNDVALLTQANNMGQFLTDTAYRTFYNGTISSRSEKILVSNDDGFLYAFDQSDGQLDWGWMPRSLVGELKNYTSFQGLRLMRGTVDIIDAKDSLGNYDTYVVGSYKDGLGQYVLKLDSDGDLDSVVWDQDYSASFNVAPNHGEKDYFRDGSGQTYVTYVVTDSSNQSTLVVREITNAATNTEVALNFNATSTPFVIQNFGNTKGPAAKTLYLGDDSGNIKRTALLTGGSLDNSANLKLALEGSSVGTLNAAEPILFLGASSSTSGGLYYLRAQSESRLTILDYNNATTNWDKRWTSYVGGAGLWDSSNVYTADTSGAPTDVDKDGFYSNVTANGIQSLPADARITDAAQIVSNTVIVPVSVQASGDCFGRAYFYVYNLTDGVFPDYKLMKMDSSKITGDIALGFGEPSRVNISDMPSNELMIGHGITDQNTNNKVEIDTSFLINDKVSTGIRGWKEWRQE